MTSETQVDAIRIRRNPWVTALSCVPWAVALGLAMATLVTGAPFIALAPHFSIIGAFVFLATWRRKPYARHESARVEVDDHVARIGGEMIPRGLVKNANLFPTLDGPVVRVAIRKQLDRDLLLQDENDAHRLMTALGFDASQRTARYPLMSLALTRFRLVPFAVIAVYFAFVALASALHIPELFGVALPIFGIAMLTLVLKRASVVVGVDGVLVRWLWTRQFIAMKDILLTSRFERRYGRNRIRGVELATNTHGAVQLPVSSFSNEDMLVMLHRRIDDAMALAKSAVHVADEAHSLARGGAGLREWIARLKAIGAGATATLRTAAVMPDQLWRVASDPAEAAMTRVAAAIALTQTLDESGRMRLSDLAKTTAAPKLRVALERAAYDAPDEEIEEAMRELESE